jgi:hypothetical protein
MSTCSCVRLIERKGGMRDYFLFIDSAYLCPLLQGVHPDEVEQALANLLIVEWYGLLDQTLRRRHRLCGDGTTYSGASHEHVCNDTYIGDAGMYDVWGG